MALAATQTAVFHATTTLQPIAVPMIDGKGNFVPGVTAGDFTLLELKLLDLPREGSPDFAPHGRETDSVAFPVEIWSRPPKSGFSSRALFGADQARQVCVELASARR